MNSIQQAIADLTLDRGLDEELAGQVATEILAGEATPAQIGSFLTALRIRGEQPHHLIAFARTMRKHAAAVPARDAESLVDTCGTGGDSSGTFNISTTAAFIAAGAGARIAKHGNRAITGKCGSADVLKALGVNIDLGPEGALQCLERTGFAFFFAPLFHESMRHAGPPRREVGIRTIFNMLGPLSNPSGAERQLIGVYSKHLTQVFAEVLMELGSKHVMIVHGNDGLDEITLTGPTTITEARDGKIETTTLRPEDLGLTPCKAEELLGRAPEENAALTRAILDGEAGAKRNIAQLNAAAALIVGGKAKTFVEGYELAGKAIDSGAARKILDNLIKVSNEVASV